MPFHRIDVLPNYRAEKATCSRKRWAEDSEAVKDKVLDLIRKGAGEDFLQWDLENGNLGFMEDQWDLAGIDLFKEEIEFPSGDNFENIDFSFANFWHCKFRNATFPQTRFTFTRLYNVEFHDCLFGFAHFYGATLEKCKFINCDFVEENGFSNCELIDTKFQNCFFNKNKFTDCRFDENVTFTTTKGKREGGLLVKPNSRFLEQMDGSAVSGIYRNIKDGYLAGQVHVNSRKYLFLQHQAYTRYNSVSIFERSKRFCWELLAGYGVKPMRVLICFMALFAIICLWFSYRLGSVQEGLLLSAGAFLTFGAKADLLSNLGVFDYLLYISAAFSGIALISLFVTVMANVLLKES